jgi:hypothetical protein
MSTCNIPSPKVSFYLQQLGTCSHTRLESHCAATAGWMFLKQYALASALGNLCCCLCTCSACTCPLPHDQCPELPNSSTPPWSYRVASRSYCLSKVTGAVRTSLQVLLHAYLFCPRVYFAMSSMFCPELPSSSTPPWSNMWGLVTRLKLLYGAAPARSSVANARGGQVGPLGTGQTRWG